MNVFPNLNIKRLVLLEKKWQKQVEREINHLSKSDCKYLVVLVV